MMLTVLHRVAAVLAGAVFAGLVVSSTDAAVAGAFPLPPGTDLTNPSSVRAALAVMPTPALVLLATGWVIAAGAGSFLAAVLAPTPRVRHGLIVVTLLLVATVANLVMIPHPVWMWVVAVTLIPAVGFGAAHAAVMVRPEATRP
jgi:hypothetical protein